MPQPAAVMITPSGKTILALRTSYGPDMLLHRTEPSRIPSSRKSKVMTSESRCDPTRTKDHSPSKRSCVMCAVWVGGVLMQAPNTSVVAQTSERVIAERLIVAETLE